MINELAKTTNYNLTTKQAQDTKRVFDLLPISRAPRADYKARIGLYIDFINQHGMSRNTLLEFRGYLEGRTDYSVSTKNKYFTTANGCTGVMYTAGLIPVDATKDISGKDIKGFTQNKKQRLEKDGLTNDDVTRLTNYLQTLEPSPATARLKALFSVFMLQGLRQVEVVRLVLPI